MIRHSMDVMQRAVEFLNPVQIPVFTVDQPLFAIAKQIQWQWSDTYGEDKFIVLLGGLHIEMAVLTTLGDFLDSSGWTNAITQADVAAAGMADSFLNSTNVKRTRHAHQVTCNALSILHDAYEIHHQENLTHYRLKTGARNKLKHILSSSTGFCMKVIESYVILLYDITCTERNVDSARKQIFAGKARSIDGIPPTQAALLQHTKPAIHQGEYVWGQAHIRSPGIPSPELWGWRKTPKQESEPLWTLLPEVAVSCSELLRCGCLKGCRGHCKCPRAELKCTSLCRCSGNCERNDGV